MRAHASVTKQRRIFKRNNVVLLGGVSVQSNRDQVPLTRDGQCSVYTLPGHIQLAQHAWNADLLRQADNKLLHTRKQHLGCITGNVLHLNVMYMKWEQLAAPLVKSICSVLHSVQQHVPAQEHANPLPARFPLIGCLCFTQSCVPILLRQSMKRMLEGKFDCLHLCSMARCTAQYTTAPNIQINLASTSKSPFQTS